jgi:putative PIN family toxin of toxin-antitoxin system
MTACLDTGVFLQIFGRKQPFHPILRALLDGQLTLAVSTEILLEYEEVTKRLSGVERWRDVAALLELLVQLHGNIRHVEPQFRFRVITADPDDNKFCDCAIAAEAEFVVAEDNHFEALKSAGYKPQPIKPDEFIRRYLV